MCSVDWRCTGHINIIVNFINQNIEHRNTVFKRTEISMLFFCVLSANCVQIPKHRTQTTQKSIKTDLTRACYISTFPHQCSRVSISYGEPEQQSRAGKDEGRRNSLVRRSADSKDSEIGGVGVFEDRPILKSGEF